MRNIRASSEDRESGENRALYKVPLEMKGFIARACCSFFSPLLYLSPPFLFRKSNARSLAWLEKKSYAPFSTKFAGNRGKVVLFLRHRSRGNNRTSTDFACLAFDNLSRSLSLPLLEPRSFSNTIPSSVPSNIKSRIHTLSTDPR